MGYSRTFGNRDCQRDYLERFHRGCFDYLNRQFVPKWDSPNGEGELATARTALLLVGLECVAEQPLTGWIDEGGRHGESQEAMGSLEHASYVPTESPVCEVE